MIRRIGKTILDILFPKFCFSCKSEGKYLCEKCTLFISEATFVCPSCKKTAFFGRKHKKCEGHVDSLISFWEYEGVVKEMISRGKKESLIDVFKELIEYGFLSVGNNTKKFSKFFDFLFNEETVIIHVPIHREKELKRGFDSAKEIAKSIARLTKKEFTPYLERNINTKSQNNLREKERIINMKNAFSFTSQRKIKNVVLVNDLWESGATTKEAAKVLKENGVKRVWAFVLAKTP